MNKTYLCRFKNERDIGEILKARDLYIQAVSSSLPIGNSTKDEEKKDKTNSILNTHYQLKSSRPPCFTSFTLYRTYRVELLLRF